MQVTLFATLRAIAGERRIALALPPGATVMTLLEALAERWPEMREHFFTEEGGLSRQVNVFIGGRNVRWLEGAETSLDGVEEVDLFPPVAGG